MKRPAVTGQCEALVLILAGACPSCGTLRFEQQRCSRPAAHEREGFAVCRAHRHGAVTEPCLLERRMVPKEAS